MFKEESKTNVTWYGAGTFEIFSSNHETFLWQWRAEGTVSCGDETKKLPANCSILVPENVRLSLVNDADSITLSVAMPMTQ